MLRASEFSAELNKIPENVSSKPLRIDQKKTLIPLVQKWIQPGTIIVSDVGKDT